MKTMIIRGRGLATWKGWAGRRLPVSFKQVKIVQEFENKVKTMPLGVLNFLKSVIAYLIGRNQSRYHDRYREKVKPTMNDNV